MLLPIFFAFYFSALDNNKNSDIQTLLIFFTMLMFIKVEKL